MKRILTILLLLIGLQGFSQPGFQGYLTNNSYRGMGASQKAYLPADTFNVTGSLRNYKWIAIKNNTIYLWTLSELRWIAIGGGGGTTYTFTLPLLNTSNTVSIKGLSGVGSAGQVPISNGSQWAYHYPFNHDSAVLYSFETKGLVYAKDGGDNLDTLTFGGLDSTFTPTLSSSTNVTASTVRTCHIVRVGNRVTGSGTVDITPTAASGTATIFYLSLAIPSNFSTTYDASGTATRAGASYEPGFVQADVSGDKLMIRFSATNTASGQLNYTFTYLIQ